MIWVLCSLCIGFCSSISFNTLICLKMIFNQMDFASSVDPLEGVRTISVDVSISIWSSSVREQNSHLMECFGCVLPESKNSIWILNIPGGTSFLGMNEIWELDWIIDKENWSIVSDKIIISFFGVELNSESSWISNCICSSSFTCNS